MNDGTIRKIEIDFALPVTLTGYLQQRLDAVVGEICDANCPLDAAFWPSGCGSKPNFSVVDALFLGKPHAADAPATGEPTWDDSVYHIDCCARPLEPEEIENRRYLRAPNSDDCD